MYYHTCTIITNVLGYGKTTFKKSSNKLLYLKLNVPDQAKMRYDVAYKRYVTAARLSSFYTFLLLNYWGIISSLNGPNL